MTHKLTAWIDMAGQASKLQRAFIMHRQS